MCSPPTLISSLSRRKREGERREARGRARYLLPDRETITLERLPIENELRRSRESIAHATLSPSPAGIREATEGKREWDSPSAMLMPCARVLAFNPAVYRLATDTLVSPSPARFPPPPPPNALLSHSFCICAALCMFATPAPAMPGTILHTRAPQECPTEFDYR